jgi:hypothetical protein
MIQSVMTQSFAAESTTDDVWAGIVAPAEEIGGRYWEDCHGALPSEGAA